MMVYIVFECPQRTFTTKEALNNQMDEMTWPVDISQHLSLVAAGTPVLAQWVTDEELCIDPTAGAASHQAVIYVSSRQNIWIQEPRGRSWSDLLLTPSWSFLFPVLYNLWPGGSRAEVSKPGPVGPHPAHSLFSHSPMS